MGSQHFCEAHPLRVLAEVMAPQGSCFLVQGLRRSVFRDPVGANTGSCTLNPKNPNP